jgi:hypothetical protein
MEDPEIEEEIERRLLELGPIDEEQLRKELEEEEALRKKFLLEAPTILQVTEGNNMEAYVITNDSSSNGNELDKASKALLALMEASSSKIKQLDEYVHNDLKMVAEIVQIPLNLDESLDDFQKYIELETEEYNMTSYSDNAENNDAKIDLKLTEENQIRILEERKIIEKMRQQEENRIKEEQRKRIEELDRLKKLAEEELTRTFQAKQKEIESNIAKISLMEQENEKMWTKIEEDQQHEIEVNISLNVACY